MRRKGGEEGRHRHRGHLPETLRIVVVVVHRGPGAVQRLKYTGVTSKTNVPLRMVRVFSSLSLYLSISRFETRRTKIKRVKHKRRRRS